jgi:myo-inositol-1(or 4)-monophosphatase
LLKEKSPKSGTGSVSAAPGKADARWQDDLALILEAAHKAGAVALDYFRQSPEVWWKNEGRSPVSAADIAANSLIRDMLSKARPDYGWLSEENEDDETRLTRSTVFVVDPIDGTRAFIHGKDTWCVSIAVVHEGQPVAGVLVAPALNEEYQAHASGPALKNGMPIFVATGDERQTVRLALSEESLARLKAPFKNRVFRHAHVPSLAYRIAMIADGSIDGTIVQKNSHDWDLAAADLILQRAGGRLTGLDGVGLSYNRPTVRHDVLCAASAQAEADLLAATQIGFGH